MVGASHVTCLLYDASLGESGGELEMTCSLTIQMTFKGP